MRVNETKTITAQNIFTGWVQIDGVFQLHIAGVVGSTVTFQGSPDAGVTVYDLDTYSTSTANTMHVGTLAQSNWVYRAGVKTGEYASDTVILRMEA
jgi:hypothetical protein